MDELRSTLLLLVPSLEASTSSFTFGDEVAAAASAPVYLAYGESVSDMLGLSQPLNCPLKDLRI